MKFFTAGPSQTYPTLPFHLATAMDSGILSISHRSSAFMDLYQAMEDGLKKVLNIPDGYHVFVFSSATEIWERIALNCVARESFHFVNGNFSQSFRDIVGMTGKQAHVCVVPEGEGFDVQSVEIPDSAELIAAIANRHLFNIVASQALSRMLVYVFACHAHYDDDDDNDDDQPYP